MRFPRRFRTGLVSFLMLVVVGLGAMPSVARAAPPSLTAVGQTSRHLIASWSLPPGTQPRVIEAAVSPETSSDGYFFSENVREFSTLEDGQTSYVGNSQLEPGTYYVHVGGYDESCLECQSREFSSIVVLTVPADPPPPLPTLTVTRTKSLIRTALKRRFGRAYRFGYAKQLSSCTRRSKTRVTCRRVSWIVGDASYRGRATIWLTRKSGVTLWNYAYTIKRTDEYCASTGGRNCTRTYRVR